MRSLLASILICLTVVTFLSDVTEQVNAEEITLSTSVENIDLTVNSKVDISTAFGNYQKIVDENIYYSLCVIDDNTLLRIFGNRNTPMFNKALECLNPCMAMATTWGEAGCSYAGVSLTTMMDFQPSTYKHEIDWISVSQNLSQVDSLWYITNASTNVNTCVDGKAFRMPNALLQFPRNGSRETSEMVGLGVGPYQITSSDWDTWDLDNRVNPVYGFEDSLKKIGTAWIDCGIEPISDITVYAVMSLGHQGGGLITYDFGKQLINIFNREDVQVAINEVGFLMYNDMLQKQSLKPVSLADCNMNSYIAMVESKTGIDFSKYTGGPGSTNKGYYTLLHVLRYSFYKYYFTGGLNETY